MLEAFLLKPVNKGLYYLVETYLYKKNKPAYLKEGQIYDFIYLRPIIPESQVTYL